MSMIELKSLLMRSKRAKEVINMKKYLLIIVLLLLMGSCSTRFSSLNIPPEKVNSVTITNINPISGQKKEIIIPKKGINGYVKKINTSTRIDTEEAIKEVLKEGEYHIFVKTDGDKNYELYLTNTQNFWMSIDDKVCIYKHDGLLSLTRSYFSR